MGSTAQKLQYLVDAKASIDAALTAKGVTPPTALADYGTAIGTLGYKDKLQQVVDRSVTEITAEDLDGATKIGDYAFYFCLRLTNVIFPVSITEIGTYAFRNCTRLTNITIPSNITMVGLSAFHDCIGLTDVTIQNGVLALSSYVFANCANLTNITIPYSVTSLGALLFVNCTRLTSVTILATDPPTLENSNAFNNTNNCPIYVPAASVEAYKAATNWASLSSRIFAIQE